MGCRESPPYSTQVRLEKRRKETAGAFLPAVSRPCFLLHDSAKEDRLIQRSPRREWGWRGGPGMPVGDWLWVDAPQIPVTPGGLSYLGPGAACLLPAAVLSPPTRDSGEFPLPHPHLALDSVTCLDLGLQRYPPIPLVTQKTSAPLKPTRPGDPALALRPLLRPCPLPRGPPPFTRLDLLRQRGDGVSFCDCWVPSSFLRTSVPALHVGELLGCATLSGGLAGRWWRCPVEHHPFLPSFLILALGIEEFSSEPALPPTSSITDGIDLRPVVTTCVTIMFLTSKKALTELTLP